MKKTTLLLLQVFLIFTACSCLIGDLASQLRPDTSSPDPEPSDFDLWARGIPIGIQIDCGKESLTNFSEQFDIQITATHENGAPFNGSLEYLMEIDRANETRYEIETVQIPSDYLSGVREYVVTDGYTYRVHDVPWGEGRTCDKEELPADTSHYADEHVIRILQTITPGELIEENVLLNDMLADVYEIEDLSLLFARELSSVNGKVWIAQRPVYFLQAEGTVEGIFEFENNLYNGNATFHYEIKGFNQVQVQLPALCANPPEDMIPRPANARDEIHYMNSFTFSSNDTLDQLMSFYLEELVSQGWQVEEGPGDVHEQVLQASITTQQGIQIWAEVKIIKMGGDYSQVKISYQAQ